MNFDDIFCQGSKFNIILIDSIKHLLKEHHAALFAYVIMPNHLHILLYIPKGQSIIDFMRDFKKFTSVEIRKQAEKDRMIDLLRTFKNNAKATRKQEYKIWMDRFDDVIISTERMMGIKVNYIHYNPVKAGLVERPEDWKYSSARNYLLDDHSIIKIRTDWSID